MSGFLRDVRFALRTLARSPGYATAAILVLALGIGANAAIFSVTRAVLLDPLPFRAPERLAWVWATRVDRDRAFYSLPNFRDTREAAKSFEELAAFSPWGPTLSGDGEPERLSAVRVTGNAFRTLGVRPAAGRLLDDADAEPQASRLAVISHGLWSRRFASDPGLVGRTVTLNGESYTVVGILGREFLFPGAEDADLAVPISLTSDPRHAERGSNSLRVFGRLVAGADAARAAAELAPITAALASRHPLENAKLTPPRVLPLTEEVVGGARPLLVLLFAAVGLLLLVACANIAALSLVRGLARRHEAAVRKALGASRLQLAAPFFAESLVVTAAGALAALALAGELTPLLVRLAPAALPRAGNAGVEGPVFLFATILAAACAAACGLGPALVAARAPAAGSLGARGAWSPRAGRARRAFVLAQVATSLALLVGAALLAKSFARRISIDPGFSADRVVSVRLTLGKDRYADAATASRFFERATASLRELPGVEAAGTTSVLPLSGMNSRQDFEVVGRPAGRASETPGAQSRWVDAGYFATLGIPVRRGRAFTDRDDGAGEGVAIVDEPLARRLFPAGDAVGSRLRLEDAVQAHREARIVGVVGGVRHFSLEEEPVGTLYLPVAQMPENMLSIVQNSVHLVARTSGDPVAAAAAVRRAIRSIDPDVPTGSLRTMDEVRGVALASHRFSALLVAVFALAAAALAGIGIYGTLSELVAQDRRPIGIRLALGASPALVLRGVVRRGVGLALSGIGIGVLVSVPASRLLSASLYRVSPADPWAYLAGAGLLLILAGAASLLPARRAARMDPMAALRAE